MSLHVVAIWENARFSRAIEQEIPVQILVVDDEPAIQRMLKFSFESLGYKVVLAHNAAEAQAAYEPGTTSMVLLDIMMPGMDGLSLCRAWRSAGETVPIIFLTARDEVYPGEYAEAGATEWIFKPCSLRDLLAPLHKYCPLTAQR